MRPIHIVDTYDVYTTLGPPMNSLRRSPTEYRCNKVSRKTLLVYCNGIISSPYVLNQPPQHTLLQNSVVFVTTTFGSAADKDVYMVQLPAECEEEGRCTYYFLPSTLPLLMTGISNTSELIWCYNIRPTGGSTLVVCVLIIREEKEYMHMWYELF